MRYPWIVLGLLALVGGARADVTVNFVSPEKFSDIRDNNGFHRPELLKDLQAHMVARTGKSMPGLDVRFDVTDVDLAGEIEPFGRRGEWLRVMRAVTSPAMTLKYEVRQGDRILRQGEATLRDLDYQNAFVSLSDSDPLRHEKRMFDRWMEREFAPEGAAARQP